MANVQRVINLIFSDDSSVKLSCFNHSANTTDEELYDSWIDFIRKKLGNCCFTGDTYALLMYSEAGQTLPHPVASTEQVIELVTGYFDTPVTLRLELVTQYNTTFTWLFVLSSDLLN